MLARKLRRAFKKGGNKYKKFVKKYAPKDTSHSYKKSNEVVVCYGCNKSGHIKPNCPKIKKKKSRMDKGKKVMATT